MGKLTVVPVSVLVLALVLVNDSMLLSLDSNQWPLCAEVKNVQWQRHLS
jgi:hypothetical protein